MRAKDVQPNTVYVTVYDGLVKTGDDATPRPGTRYGQARTHVPISYRARSFTENDGEWQVNQTLIPARRLLRATTLEAEAEKEAAIEARLEIQRAIRETDHATLTRLKERHPLLAEAQLRSDGTVNLPLSDLVLLIVLPEGSNP